MASPTEIDQVQTMPVVEQETAETIIEDVTSGFAPIVDFIVLDELSSISGYSPESSLPPYGQRSTEKSPLSIMSFLSCKNWFCRHCVS